MAGEFTDYFMRPCEGGFPDCKASCKGAIPCKMVEIASSGSFDFAPDASSQ